MSTDDNEDFKVGYKKPPRHSRWKKGQSGNAKGRKPKATDIDGHTDEHLRAKTFVTIDGRRRRITNEELIAMQRVEKAKRGDRHATDEIYAFRRSSVKPTLVFTPEDETTVNAALARMGEASKAAPQGLPQSGWTSKPSEPFPSPGDASAAESDEPR